MIERPDLDGCRLQREGDANVWLVFHGKRHRISSPAAYERLFGETQGVVHHQGIDDIALGPEIGEDTCLVRPEGSLAIYLVTGRPPDAVRRHHIPNWETLCDFGFDTAKVWLVPPVFLKVLVGGGDILSPRGRIALEPS